MLSMFRERKWNSGCEDRVIGVFFYKYVGLDKYMEKNRIKHKLV